MARQRPRTGVGEHDTIGRVAGFLDPGLQGAHRARPQRYSPLLSSFSVQLEARTAAEGDFGAAQGDDLRDPGPRVVEGEQQCVISPPGPAGAVGDSEERIDFVTRERADQAAIGPLRGNREDASGQVEALRVRSATNRKNARRAAKRALRERTLLVRCCSR